MQTREQIKNWKVVASVATVAALGVSGLAIASPGDPAETPAPIEIQDRRTEPVFTTTSRPSFEVVPAPAFTMDDSLDSPLASAEAEDSPDDSPDDSPAATSVQDSPDSSPAATSVQDSPDDSPATTSVQDSPDDSPDDSADSVDSLDS